MTKQDALSVLSAMTQCWIKTVPLVEGFCDVGGQAALTVRKAICEHHGIYVSLATLADGLEHIPDNADAGPEAIRLIEELQQQFPQLCDKTRTAVA